MVLMMMSKELIEMMRNQITLELKTAEILTPTVKATNNSIVKLLLHRLVLDSMKHADMLQSVVDLTEGKIASIAERDTMKRVLVEHVKNEKDMLNRIKKIAVKVEDAKVKALINQIVKDERMHHKILAQLLKIVEWRSIEDEQWWNFIDKVEWTF
jgi:rubrerythrin